MARDIDLTSPQWTDLVFEGKNKEYGAYEMRNDSSNRHLKALIIIVIVGLAAVYLPNLIKKPTALKEVVKIGQNTDVTLTDVTIDDKIVPIQPDVLPPSFISTIGFVTMVVVPDELVDPNDKVTTQAELTESNLTISTATVKGEENGTLDIRDVETITGTSSIKEDVPRQFVEQMPQPVGGMNELLKWLSSNLHYPPAAVESNIQGKVIVRFVVRQDGAIDDVAIVRSLEPGCDKEAVRVVKKMQKWIPGKQNGNPVSVYYTLPIQFKLQNQ